MLAISDFLSQIEAVRPSAAPTAARTVADLLRAAADRFGARPAIGEAGRDTALSFQALDEATHVLRAALRGWNIGPADRVATLLPPGPLAAATMCGVMSTAVYAPLDPRGTQAEIMAALSALGVRAVIVPKNTSGAGRSAATQLGLPIIEAASTDGAPPGIVELSCERPPDGCGDDRAADHAPAPRLACVLRTSGSTAEPKVVPITQAALLGAIMCNVDLLELTAADRTLHVIAPVHVMGITTILYSIMAGAQTICCPGLVAGQYFEWVRRHQPTWMTAPPALHHSIAAAAEGHEDYLAAHPLRFTRTGAAPMPPTLAQRIERLWHAPLIEAYAMSECQLITSNGLVPGACRAGTVGRACCGTELMIVDDAGVPLPAGTAGEILLHGPNVITAYEKSEQANRDALVAGWFRTGDVGRLDDDGFLTLVSRKKELINRGGVKIAPLEIDRAIEKHSAVAAALAFAIPDARLGEKIGVAVVLRPGHSATESAVREFAAVELGPEKVPQRVAFVDALPAGPGGKLLRVGLAAKLGVDYDEASPAAFDPPASTTEAALAAIWTDVLRARSPISVTARFVEDLGGDSLQAVAMLEATTAVLGRAVPVAKLIAAPTIRTLAETFDAAATSSPGAVSSTVASSTAPSSTVPSYLSAIRAAADPTTARPPVFFLPGMHGHSFTFYPLARALGGERDLFAFTLPGVFDDEANLPDTVEALAEIFLTELRQIQPHGPYLLAGYSFGGYIGYDMARRLIAQGEQVERLIMFDVRGPGYPERAGFLHRMRYHARKVMAGPWAQRANFLRTRNGRGPHASEKPTAADTAQATTFATDGAATSSPTGDRSMAMMRRYVPRPSAIPIDLIRAVEQPAGHAVCRPDRTMGWGRFAPVRVRNGPGSHFTILEARHAAALSNVVRESLTSEPAAG